MNIAATGKVMCRSTLSAYSHGLSGGGTSTIPPGGKDAGGTSFVRVTPSWYGSWCARRDTVPHVLREAGRLALAVHYADPVRAAHWLRDAFGFALSVDMTEGGPDAWIEFRVGYSPLIIFKRDSADATPPGSPTHVTWVFGDDLDAHFARAQAKGARIVEPIRQHGYRAYVAEDLEGHRWTFAQTRPTQR
jgi:uncharacterized glyoxalase superfamily protein PhnB